jgi:signal transduction histidine kinase
MKKLRTRFGLALSAVLLVATLLPVLLLYLLSASGLVEATYVTGSGDILQTLGTELPSSRVTPPDTSDPSILRWREEQLDEDMTRLAPLINPETGNPFPFIYYDLDTGRLTPRIPSDFQRIVFTSPVFKFRVDLPAWFVLGSLPMLSLLIGVFLSVLMSRSVTQPVSQLAEAAQAIGRRDLNYRVEVKGSQELQDLAQSFNRMAEQLEHAETTRRNLMADVAHELRTPLAVLEGNLRAILDGVHELNEEEIALLYEQTHHLNRLVEDVHELSLAEAHQLSLECKEVDLARLVKDTKAHFELIAQEQGVQLSLELDEPLIHPCLDENRMRQVLHNLLANAFRYTPSGGKVAITAKRKADEGALEITVMDTGMGISAEELPHIFNRFYQTKDTASRDRGGTGLGLAIVKAIVQAQGGQVSVVNPGPNQGSTFKITFGETASQPNHTLNEVNGNSSS